MRNLWESRQQALATVRAWLAGPALALARAV